jgi:hypothetical protein
VHRISHGRWQSRVEWYCRVERFEEAVQVAVQNKDRALLEEVMG